MLKKTIFWATEILDQISVLHNSYRVSMATKDSIMKQSIFFWVFGHRLSFEYGLKKFLFGAWRNLSGALRELILNFNGTAPNVTKSNPFRQRSQETVLTTEVPTKESRLYTLLGNTRTVIFLIFHCLCIFSICFSSL